MSGGTASKVTAVHLDRIAFLYVRQSTLGQVIHNTESGTRQYALRQRAVSLGWPTDRIVTIGLRPGPIGRFGLRPGRVPTVGGRGG